MKKVIIFSVLAGVTINAVATVSLLMPKPRLVWNATASAPTGLYWAISADDLKLGDLLIIMPPPGEASFMDERGYLPFGAVLLKRVAALSGAEICRRGARIFVDGKEIAQAKKSDGQGRSLPQWHGCHRLSAEQVFLVNADVQDSLDGRYFGPFPKSSIVGLAYPLWTDEEKRRRR
jgi:conjugative transfer signal peptidase TraF